MKREYQINSNINKIIAFRFTELSKLFRRLWYYSLSVFRIHQLQLAICTIFLSLTISSCVHDPLFDQPTPVIPDIQTENPCDPDTSYFYNHVFPIIKSSCAFSGCHGDGSAQDGVDLSSYASIINTADVRPYDLDGSDLYEVITEDRPDKRMPPPPHEPLSTEQIASIAKWINQGAHENKCDDCDTLDVSFALHIKPLIENNCKACHSGPSPSGNISLILFENIQELALTGALYGSIAHLPSYTPMPYNQTALNDCQLAQIRKWVNAGAQEN